MSTDGSLHHSSDIVNPSLDCIEGRARLKAGLAKGSQAEKLFSGGLPFARKVFGNTSRTWWYNVSPDDYPNTENFTREVRDLRQSRLSDARLDERSPSDPSHAALGEPFSMMCCALGRELKSAFPAQYDRSRKDPQAEHHWEGQYAPTRCSETLTIDVTYYKTNSESGDTPQTCQKHTVKTEVSVIGLWSSGDEASEAGEGPEKGRWNWYLERPQTVDGGQLSVDNEEVSVEAKEVSVDTQQVSVNTAQTAGDTHGRGSGREILRNLFSRVRGRR